MHLINLRRIYVRLRILRQTYVLIRILRVTLALQLQRVGVPPDCQQFLWTALLDRAAWKVFDRGSNSLPRWFCFSNLRFDLQCNSIYRACFLYLKRHGQSRVDCKYYLKIHHNLYRNRQKINCKLPKKQQCVCCFLLCKRTSFLFRQLIFMRIT